MRHLLAVFGFILFASHANALSVSDLSNTEATGGLKEALIQAAGKAVGQLGAVDGFLGNKEVKIPLPETMQKAEKAMRMFGMGKQADELVLKMNRAAEAAVPEAKALLVDSVKKMSVADAKAILTGGDDAATQYFKRTTSTPMAEKFLPIVKKATENVQLAQQYNKFAELGSKYGMVKKEQANLEQYVTQKTLDGVYLMMAKEEATIRKDPVGQASNAIKKVFGSLIK
ncbi:MAG: hypothetical protein CTY38_12650 [Methylotenera sp.]|uniref:DUF4197 domain-containing protein n=1 Tax=Methylotenera sp. TaxID=2051956 RepID=UPI000D4B29EF|nr:DUF4197 domain-containing protein [Methylotenera sp.]PPC79655.1 MAG: hypothetical protein CTY38_12650 [Methylotenera sp.]